MARQPNPGHRGLALAAVGLATFMTSLDNTVVNVALPSIQRDLGLSLSGLEWIASAYVLAFAGLLLAGGGAAALAAACGPLAGGFVSQHWHWSWSFFSNVPLGALTLVLGGTAITESRGTRLPRGLDLPGLAAATLALTALSYALIQGHAAGWTSPPILAALAVAAAASAAFAAAEARSPAPMMDLALFRSPVFAGGTV